MLFQHPKALYLLVHDSNGFASEIRKSAQFFQLKFVDYQTRHNGGFSVYSVYGL